MKHPKLFYVKATSPDGDSLDLLVYSENASTARLFWRIYYDLGVDAKPECAFEVFTAVVSEGPIDWSDMTRHVFDGEAL
jgi:hypothetical protein